MEDNISSSNFIDAGKLARLDYPTPYFLFDKSNIAKTVELYRTDLESAEIAYAMKSNSEPEILQAINANGCSFEVASEYELEMVKKIGVPDERIICGTSVKSPNHIKAFAEYGVERYAADSASELDKLAELAPGCKVYIRVLVDDSSSVFRMSSKFGVDSQLGEELLVKAKAKGLVPYGLSFNVGSQSRDEAAWGNGIKNLVASVENLQKKGIKLEALNLGGGYPWQYDNGYDVPKLRKISEHIQEALLLMPYQMKLIVEPGRGLVAPCMALVVSVIANIKRASGNWLYVDAGAYNALLETMAYQGSIRYKIEPVGQFGESHSTSFIVTGPTGDSLDVIDKAAILPQAIKPGDKLIVHDVGAYSTVLSTQFNGFPKPPLKSV
jgi:ornithine decarboxylase